MATDSFAGRLLPNERMLWSGRPRQGLMLTARDAFLIPFSLLWGGFAIFWETEALSKNAPWFMALWGVPFVAIGLFMIFGRLPVDAWLRRRVHYALTDRRVLILRERPWSSFKAVALDRLPDATLTEGSDGRGTIRFAQPAAIWGGYGNNGAAFLVYDPAIRRRDHVCCGASSEEHAGGRGTITRPTDSGDKSGGDGCDDGRLPPPRSGEGDRAKHGQPPHQPRSFECNVHQRN